MWEMADRRLRTAPTDYRVKSCIAVAAKKYRLLYVIHNIIFTHTRISAFNHLFYRYDVFNDVMTYHSENFTS